MTEASTVMRLALLASVVLLFGGSALADQDEDDYRVPRYRMGKIVKIEVSKPSVREDYDPQESCDTFVMTRKLAIEFFRHSRVTSRHYFRSDSSLSSCSSEGRVTFASGDSGQWTIYRNGRGILYLTAGKGKGQLVPMHCNRCEEWNM